MKKFLGFVCFLFVGSALFAQTNFSLCGQLSTNFTGVTPAIGIEVPLGNMDVLGGARFNMSSNEYDYTTTTNTDYTDNMVNLELFAGVALKLLVMEKLSVTLPILGGVDIENTERSYPNISGKAKTTDFYFSVKAGPRVYYVLNEKWNLYTGALFNVLGLGSYTNSNTQGNNTLEQKTMSFGVFTSGRLELGIRYTF